MDGNGVTAELEKILRELTNDQIRFVVARTNISTDKEAAESVLLNPRTVISWKTHGAPIDEAVRLMVHDGMVTALELRRRSLAQAMAVKIAGLESRSEKTRQSVATEIIEWEMGRATQRNEVSGKDGGVIRLVWDDNDQTTAAP